MVVVPWWWSAAVVGGGLVVVVSSLVVVVRGLYYIIFCNEYDSFLYSGSWFFFVFVVLVWVLLSVVGDGWFWGGRGWG